MAFHNELAFAETNDKELNLGMHILNHILLGTPASPLRKKLIESGLGEDITGDGLDSDLRQMIFSCGLKGYHQKDQYKIENLIRDTLAELAENGIDKDTIEASINTAEFILRENNTGYFPRGLSLMLRSLTTWLYDYDPFEPLTFEKPLSRIKEYFHRGEPYFEKLIEKYFLTNKHCTIVILKPDELLEEKSREKEKSILQAMLDQMNDDERRVVIQKSKALVEYQNKADSPEDLAKIPSLKLSDIDKFIKTVPKVVYKDELGFPANTEVLHHPLFTNRIIYLDLGFDLRGLPQELLPYCPIFARSLIEFGTKSEDYIKLIQRIGKHTGGISASYFFSPKIGNPQQCIAKLIVRSKATPDKFLNLLDIFKRHFAQCAIG
jgi:Zn-dependent M16 (insulinase) family peptidase